MLRMADGKSNGRPCCGLDTIIVAIATASDCLVVTDNDLDFAGVEIVKPIRGAS
ncbi:type II toxin-antitoxin system VapC family toxin [Xanthomonas campestris]|uniref:type II toxin-antitoxin system VapC family toxin n=2 Tax=Xanthomonas campestris TaxID=339 RepID=UPI0011AFD02F|nr:type II toxin-antitoxin system VapC family toxin [Xanthomonas campestris]